MEAQLSITTERIDDVVLLLHVMMQMKLPQLLNKQFPRHWKQQGLDWGWVIVIWFSYILSQGDHRKVVVRDWVNERRSTLEQVCGLELRETDFTDDRLSIVLNKLSDSSSWSELETHLNRQTIRIYRLAQEQVRLDATTVSGHHHVSDDGLFQFGHSKDDPSLPQLKAMMASLDPLGMPLATHIVSGEHADDRLYLPIFEQVRQTFASTGLLWSGDCKMAAIAIRAQIHHHQHYYLTPLARVGTVPEQLIEYISLAQTQPSKPMSVERVDKKGHLQEIATGYEFSREQTFKQEDGPLIEWTERVLLVHSAAYAQQLQRGLQQRLDTATEKLINLTPSPGRGKRQIRELHELQTKANEILKTHRVEGLLVYHYEYQPATKQHKARYQITEVTRNTHALESTQQTFGWRLYVTNAPVAKLSFETAVLSFRDAWIQERGFSRLKGKSLGASPLFVQRDEQAQGLMHLLSLGLRILTVIEFVVRRNLKHTEEKLLALFPGNPKRATARPTAERLLKAFSSISLTIVEGIGEQYIHVPDLNAVQRRILQLLELPPDIYDRLKARPA